MMKDMIEFFAQHSPGHDLVGCNSIVSEVDAIGADIDLRAPQNGSTLFEDFHNAKHFFVNCRTFQLCCGQFCEKNATVLFFCLMTAPNCGSDASVQMSQGRLGSGNVGSTFSEMSCLMALKAVNSCGVCSSFPLDQPDEAVNGAIELARLFQSAQ